MAPGLEQGSGQMSALAWVLAMATGLEPGSGQMSALAWELRWHRA